MGVRVEQEGRQVSREGSGVRRVAVSDLSDKVDELSPLLFLLTASAPIAATQTKLDDLSDRLVVVPLDEKLFSVRFRISFDQIL